MESNLLDNCLSYIKEADHYISLYNELDSYEEIFETYKPETQLKVQQNNKSKIGAESAIQKAYRTLLTFIQNLIKSFQNFFDKRNLSKEQRDAYEEFKLAAKKDPELKNKKIMVKDFTKYQAEYEKILKDAAEADRLLAENKKVNTDKLCNVIENFCSGIGKGVAVAVGAEAALNIAGTSTEIARKMYDSLQADEKLQKKLVEAIGKKESAKFERQLQSLTKRISIKRMVMKMKGTYAKSVEGAIDKTFDNVFELIDGASDIASTIPNYDSSKNITGNALQRAANNVKFAAKNFDSLNVGASRLIKNKDILLRLYGNDAVKSAIKDGIKFSGDATKDARELYRQDIIDGREYKQIIRKIKNSPTYNQSARDALLGMNDPDAKTFDNLKKARAFMNDNQPHIRYR